MCISLPKDKLVKTKKFASNILKKCTLRQLSSFIGILVSHRTCFTLAPLHYRNLQFLLIKCSNLHEWDDVITLDADSTKDIFWWINCQISDISPVKLNKTKPDLKIYTDSSKTGWGMSSNVHKISGSWSKIEQRKHINFLELKAIFLSLEIIAESYKNCFIQVFTDNISSKFYINKVGGTRSPTMCKLALEIWRICSKNNIFLSAEFVPGAQNSEADSLSRISNHEYHLSYDCFHQILHHFSYNPSIDLFASKENHKIQCYASQFVDPQSKFTDAFSSKWYGKVYLFPPINLISKTFHKFLSDKVDWALLITPCWPGLPDIPLI